MSFWRLCVAVLVGSVHKTRFVHCKSGQLLFTLVDSGISMIEQLCPWNGAHASLKDVHANLESHRDWQRPLSKTMETVDPASVHARIHHMACMVALCLTWPTELRGMCWSKPPSAWLGTQSRWLSVNFRQIDKRQDLNLQDFHQGRWNSPKSPYLARSLSHHWPSYHSTGRLPFHWTVKLTSTVPTSAWSTGQPSDIVRLPQLHISQISVGRLAWNWFS